VKKGEYSKGHLLIAACAPKYTRTHTLIECTLWMLHDTKKKKNDTKLNLQTLANSITPKESITAHISRGLPVLLLFYFPLCQAALLLCLPTLPFLDKPSRISLATQSNSYCCLPLTRAFMLHVEVANGKQ
jgi:hypothetical protein